MNTSPDPNQTLRMLIEAAGLTQAAALERFNNGLFRPYSLSTWKAYFCEPDTVRFRRVPEDVLERAQSVLQAGRGKRSR